MLSKIAPPWGLITGKATIFEVKETRGIRIPWFEATISKAPFGDDVPIPTCEYKLKLNEIKKRKIKCL